jgi:hypothetical protein
LAGFVGGGAKPAPNAAKAPESGKDVSKMSNDELFKQLTGK